MASGEISYRKGEFEKAFEQLRKASSLSDGLVYAEPWGWMQPPRHALGALLLEQGYLEESETAYKEDLVSYPNNIWSLTGLEEIYRRKGDIKQLNSILPALTLARQRAKV
jgi:tetratricopeptide (TPR) repeat protein